jgi:hypothetical protein
MLSVRGKNQFSDDSIRMGNTDISPSPKVVRPKSLEAITEFRYGQTQRDVDPSSMPRFLHYQTPRVSVCTQTTPQGSPPSTRRSSSIPEIEDWTGYEEKENEALLATLSNLDSKLILALKALHIAPVDGNEIQLKDGEAYPPVFSETSPTPSTSTAPADDHESALTLTASIKVRSENLSTPKPVKTKSTGQISSPSASTTGLGSVTRPPIFTMKKPSSLKQNTLKPGSPKSPTSKVATISPRKRVMDEIRAKKANAPPPPPPINEDRLKPEDYNLMQWSNSWAERKRSDH